MPKAVTVDTLDFEDIVLEEQEDGTVLLPEMIKMHGKQIEVYDEDMVCELMQTDENVFHGIDWEKYDYVSRFGATDYYSWKKEWLLMEGLCETSLQDIRSHLSPRGFIVGTYIPHSIIYKDSDREIFLTYIQKHRDEKCFRIGAVNSQMKKCYSLEEVCEALSINIELANSISKEKIPNINLK